MFNRTTYSYGVSVVLSAVLLVSSFFAAPGSFLAPQKAEAVPSTTDLSGYAWSDNIGWISFNCSNNGTCGTSDYKVTLDATTNNLTGYAWSENIGWIEFGGNAASGCPSGTCQAKKSGSNITGWARVVNGDTGGTVTTSTTSTFTVGSTPSFPVPPGATSITVKAWGAGGGAASTGIGGGGGGVQATYTVTPNELLTVNVGAGGTTAGTNGGATQLLRGATVLANAGGGSGSTNGSNGGGGAFSFTNSSSGVGQSGGAPNPPYMSDSSYVAGVGVGGAASTTSGNTFGPKVDYTTATGPSSVATGDLDGDGDIDFVATDSGSNDVSVFKNNGSGVFAAKVDYGASSGPWGVAIGDIDGDGDKDVVVANNGVNSISVFKNNGSGVLAAKVNYAATTIMAGVSLGDFDGDSDLDIVAGNAASTGGNTVSVWKNNGSGVFGSKVDYAVGNRPQTIAVGDINSDGKLDIAVANYGSSYVSVLKGNGDGTFMTKVNYAASAGPDGMELVDVDGDGDKDMITTAIDADVVSVFKNNGSGVFAAKVDYATGNGPSNVSVADFDSDGDMDVATANTIANTVSVLRNNGSGTFGAKTDYAGGAGGIAVGEFNGDGNTDIVSTKYGYAGGGNGTIASILLNGVTVVAAAAGGDGLMTIAYTATNPLPTNGSDGWISLNSSNGGGGSYGVGVSASEFTGYAWGSDVVGWIAVNCKTGGTGATDVCATSNYQVAVTPTCNSPINSCSPDHTQSINTDAWCTVATTTCSVGFICKDAGGLCGNADPSGSMTFANQKVRKGTTTNVSWSILYYDTCTITGTNGDTWTWASSTPATMPHATAAIQNESTYTLNCTPIGGGAPVLLDTKKVTLIPTIKQI